MRGAVTAVRVHEGARGGIGVVQLVVAAHGHAVAALLANGVEEIVGDVTRRTVVGIRLKCGDHRAAYRVAGVRCGVRLERVKAAGGFRVVDVPALLETAQIGGRAQWAGRAQRGR